MYLILITFQIFILIEYSERTIEYAKVEIIVSNQKRPVYSIISLLEITLACLSCYYLFYKPAVFFWKE